MCILGFLHEAQHLYKRNLPNLQQNSVTLSLLIRRL